MRSKYFHNEQRPFREYVQALSMALMKNTIDGEKRNAPSPAPSTSSTTSEPCCIVTPLKTIGWKGTNQLTCAICGEKTTVGCAICSKEDSVVALCKPSREWKGATYKTNCLKMHQRYPERSRRSVPKRPSVGAKRRRTAHLGDDEASPDSE